MINGFDRENMFEEALKRVLIENTPKDPTEHAVLLNIFRRGYQIIRNIDQLRVWGQNLSDDDMTFLKAIREILEFYNLVDDFKKIYPDDHDFVLKAGEENK